MGGRLVQGHARAPRGAAHAVRRRRRAAALRPCPRLPRDPPRPAGARPAAQRARDRSARRCPGRAADGPHRTRRRRARQRLGEVRPGPGARGRARARAADAGDRLALERAVRVRAPFGAGARDDAHGAGSGHVRAHAAVARRGCGDVRLRRRPRRRGAAAGGGGCRELEAAPAVQAGLDLQTGRQGSGRGVRRELGSRGGDRRRGTARAGCSGLYDAFNDSAITGRTCVATTDRVLRRTLGMSLADLEAAVAGA